jgi:phosphatidylinositol dimannoside acyltransferase
VSQRRRRHDIPESSRTFKQRISILLARILSQWARIMPLSAGYAFSDRLGDLLYWRSREYRLNVIDNLRHVHRGEIGELLLRRQARRVFRASSRNFWDLLRIPHLNPERFYENIRLPANDWSLLDRIRDEGTGCVMVTCHFGAFDVVGQTLFMRGYDPFTLTAPTVGDFVYTGVTYLRRSHGAPLEDLSPAAVRRSLRVLRRGGFVGLVADRDFTDSGEPVIFFGTETTLPSGPIRLARVSGAPIVAVFAVRDDDGGRDERYAFHILDPIYVTRTEDEQQDISTGLQRLAHVFEENIIKAPDQWVMFQRVWPERLPRRRRAQRSTRAQQRAEREVAGGGEREENDLIPGMVEITLPEPVPMSDSEREQPVAVTRAD